MTLSLLKLAAGMVLFLAALTALSSCGEEPISRERPVITAYMYEPDPIAPPIPAAAPAATEAEAVSPQPAETAAPQPQQNIVTVAAAEPTPAATAAPSPRFVTDEYSSIAPDAYLAATEDAGQEYIDSITFVGDSTTYGLKPYKMLKDGKETKQVWTPASGTLTLSYATITKIVYPDDGSEKTIAEAAGIKKPGLMVITLGVNGVSFMDEDYFKSEYGKLIDQIKEKSPDTKIILQTMFPIASNYGSQSQINNTKITAANKWIAALAQEKHKTYGDIWFLDTYSALVGSDGWMPSEYQNGDGLHLNEIGFGIELNNIRTHKVP